MVTALYEGLYILSNLATLFLYFLIICFSLSKYSEGPFLVILSMNAVEAHLPFHFRYYFQHNQLKFDEINLMFCRINSVKYNQYLHKLDEVV